MTVCARATVPMASALPVSSGPRSTPPTPEPKSGDAFGLSGGRLPAVRAFLETLAPDLLRVVVGDIHSDVDGLRSMLRHLGVLDDLGKRQRGFYVVQLGDLIHGGHGETLADRRILEKALEGRWFDEVLVGNHELYPTYGLEAGRWNGMTDPTDRRTAELLQQLHRQGGLTAASAVDGFLITHAGLHGYYERQITAGQSLTAVDLAMCLCTEFEARVRERTPRDVFDAIGPARSDGRDSRPGGIFWLDASEMAAATPPTSVPQVFGHTPQGHTPVKLPPDVWCADVGAALSGLVCALVKRSTDRDWTPYVARSPRGRRRGTG